MRDNNTCSRDGSCTESSSTGACSGVGHVPATPPGEAIGFAWMDWDALLCCFLPCCGDVIWEICLYIYICIFVREEKKLKRKQLAICTSVFAAGALAGSHNSPKIAFLIRQQPLIHSFIQASRPAHQSHGRPSLPSKGFKGIIMH